MTEKPEGMPHAPIDDPGREPPMKDPGPKPSAERDPRPEPRSPPEGDPAPKPQSPGEPPPRIVDPPARGADGPAIVTAPSRHARD